MPKRSRAIAFDVDPASLRSLQEALPAWEIESIHGATVASLSHAWNPGTANLLVVMARAQVPEMLELCRFLVVRGVGSSAQRKVVAETLGMHRGRQAQGRRGDAPLLVLVPSGQETLVRDVLEAGADCCLVLPIHAKEVSSMLAHVRQGNQPGRHTLSLDQAQREDLWQDDGGQG
jgi:hypothetical protein